MCKGVYSQTPIPKVPASPKTPMPSATMKRQTVPRSAEGTLIKITDSCQECPKLERQVFRFALFLTDGT